MPDIYARINVADNNLYAWRANLKHTPSKLTQTIARRQY